jgi:sialic acid synthase SpsE
MVSGIRNIELAISGNGIKEPSHSEQSNRLIARKSIHIANNLNKGHVLNSGDLIMKRPGDGISPMNINDVLNKTLNKDVLAEHKLSKDDLA